MPNPEIDARVTKIVEEIGVVSTRHSGLQAFLAMNVGTVPTQAGARSAVQAVLDWHTERLTRLKGALNAERLLQEHEAMPPILVDPEVMTELQRDRDAILAAFAAFATHDEPGAATSGRVTLTPA